MNRIWVIDIRETITKLKRTVEQTTFVHQSNILEKYHCVGWVLVFCYYIKYFFPVVIGSVTLHSHLIDVVLFIEHKQRSKDDARNGTQHRNKKFCQVFATHRNKHRYGSQYPERDGKMLGFVTGCYETR